MLASAVSQGSSLGSWNTALMASWVPVRGWPPTVMVPVLASSRPAIRRSSVVLPQPDPPRIATISPSPACTSTPRSASVPSA